MEEVARMVGRTNTCEHKGPAGSGPSAGAGAPAVLEQDVMSLKSVKLVVGVWKVLRGLFRVGEAVKENM